MAWNRASSRRAVAYLTVGVLVVVFHALVPSVHAWLCLDHAHPRDLATHASDVPAPSGPLENDDSGSECRECRTLSHSHALRATDVHYVSEVDPGRRALPGQTRLVRAIDRLDADRGRAPPSCA